MVTKKVNAEALAEAAAFIVFDSQNICYYLFVWFLFSKAAAEENKFKFTLKIFFS